MKIFFLFFLAFCNITSAQYVWKANVIIDSIIDRGEYIYISCQVIDALSDSTYRARAVSHYSNRKHKSTPLSAYLNLMEVGRPQELYFYSYFNYPGARQIASHLHVRIRLQRHSHFIGPVTSPYDATRDYFYIYNSDGYWLIDKKGVGAFFDEY